MSQWPTLLLLTCACRLISFCGPCLYDMSGRQAFLKLLTDSEQSSGRSRECQLLTTLCSKLPLTRSVFHRHGPSDRLLMELLLFNVHVRDWVTVPSPSLTKEFGTIGQLHYGKQSLLLVSKDSWILIFIVVRLTANFSLLLFYFLVFYCCNAQQVYAKQIPRLIWYYIH